MLPEMLGHLGGGWIWLETFVPPAFKEWCHVTVKLPGEENLSHLYIYIYIINNYTYIYIYILKKLLWLALRSCRSKHVTILFRYTLGKIEQPQTPCILSLKRNDARRHHPMRPSYDQQIEQEDGRANDKNASADDSIQHVMMSWHIYIHLPSDSWGFLCVFCSSSNRLALGKKWKRLLQILT